MNIRQQFASRNSTNFQDNNVLRDRDTDAMSCKLTGRLEANNSDID